MGDGGCSTVERPSFFAIRSIPWQEQADRSTVEHLNDTGSLKWGNLFVS